MPAWSRILSAGAFALVACRSSGSGEDPAEDARPAEAKLEPDADLEATARAHVQALERAVAPTERVLRAADPLAAWMIDQGKLRPRPQTPTTLAPLVPHLQKAQHELTDIDDDLLGPVLRVQYEALHSGLHRIDEARAGRPPTRRDPMFAVHEASVVLDAIERAHAAGGSDDVADLAAAIEALEVAARVDHRDLGAASAQTLTRAAGAYGPLASRARRLSVAAEPIGAAAQRLATTFEAIGASLQAQRTALPAEPDLTWTQWPPPAMGAAKLRRLPAELSADALARRLDVEEALTRPIAEAVPQLLRTMERIDAIGARFEVEARSPAEASPVDAVRCEAAVADMRGALGDDAPQIDCAVILPRLAAVERTDAGLRLAIFDEAVITPQARARRAAAPAWVALQSGRTAPHSHRLAKQLAFAVELGQAPVVAEALAQMRASVCATTTAVWIHGGLPDRAKLEPWLAADCTSQPAQAWIDDALADPRAAMDGLALTLVGTGPAGVTMLELVPWAPLGLVVPIAKPYRDQPATQETFRITGELFTDDPRLSK